MDKRPIISEGVVNLMEIRLEMPRDLESDLKALIIKATKEAMEENKKQLAAKSWFSISEAREYIGVSHVTFLKFREMGLPIFEVDKVKRVSKKHIDEFMEKNCY